MNQTKDLIKKLEKYIRKPQYGLPEEIFLFLTRISPVINVDLLIKNKKNETLLTWRPKGEKYPAGWHIPGGIIRFKEKISSRIDLTAKNEIGCKIKYAKFPIDFNEIHLNQINRSHFISLLYNCKIMSKPKKELKYIKGKPILGQWKWFSRCPKNIIVPHKKYKKFI